MDDEYARFAVNALRTIPKRYFSKLHNIFGVVTQFVVIIA